MHENRAYKGYFFTNMYLSALQCGLQAAHCVGRMARYPNHIFNEWINNHETIILLNGGNNEDLNLLYEDLLRITENFEYSLPVARFNEDKQSLNEATTCVGIILPNSVYDYIEEEDFGENNHDEYESQLKMLISGYQLVR